MTLEDMLYTMHNNARLSIRVIENQKDGGEEIEIFKDFHDGPKFGDLIRYDFIMKARIYEMRPWHDKLVLWYHHTDLYDR